MPQYRKLYLKTTESLDINEMPDDFTRLLWLLLPLITCREGRGMDNPAWVKSKAMPLREDVTQEEVEKALHWYARRGMIVQYKVGGRKYFEIVNWARYQGDTQREAESNYPGQDQADSDIDSRPTPDKLLTNSCSDTNTNTDTDTDTCVSILETWAALFPSKPQPRPATIGAKVKTRLKDTGFKENWRAAMMRATKSSKLREGGWFTLIWFLKTEEHWNNCLQGNYDGWQVDGGNGSAPQYATPVPEGMYRDPDDEFAIQGAIQ